jgi:8-oxo-dGTP diphosphatase
MRSKRYSGVVVKFNDKVLLCKRSYDNSFPGMWSIPGGGIEIGENSKDAAIREFLEETHIDISDYDLDFVGVVSIDKKTTDGFKSMMYVYLLNSGQKLKPDFENAVDGHEHIEWEYVSSKQLKNYNVATRLLKLLEKILEKY